MKDEQLENNIISLHSRGWSLRRLAREFRISRGRVVRIIQGNTIKRDKGEGNPAVGKPRKSKLDPYKECIGELLESYQSPPITNQRIYEILCEKGYQGGRSILGDYLTKIRGKKSSTPIVCIESLPGQRASHDWSEYYIKFTGEKQVKKVTFFSCILNYSRYQFIDVVNDKTQASLFECLTNAFIYFEGVPLEIKGDNQRACVDRWELGKPVFNKGYLQFATHYRFRPLTIRPGRPQENLKVERPFYYLETNFLNARTFRDRADVREQLHRWLKERNAQRQHRVTREKPIDLYKEEYPYLQVLPAQPYDNSIISYRIVNNESAIQWDGYFYMVPSQYMHESCPVRVKEKEIIIYNPNCQEIARWQLAEKGRQDRYVGKKKTAGKDHPSKEQVIEHLKAFGSVMLEYTDQIQRQNPKNYLHHWRHILSLKVDYYPRDIMMAVQRALKHKVFDSRAIENFLAVNASKKSDMGTLFNTRKNEKK